MNSITVYNKIKEIVKYFGKYLKFDKELSTTGRPLKLSPVEIIASGLLKQKQNIETKKSLHEILEPHCSYKTFVISLNRFAKYAGIILALILKFNRKNSHVIKHTDSTDIPVCLLKNSKYHKTMSMLSAYGKTGKGWFYGLKLHITSDLKRKILALKFSSGSIHDATITMELNKDLRGIFVADAGYLGEKLQKEFYRENKRILFTAVRKNMKKVITEWQNNLYNTRMNIELNFRNLKMFYGLLTSLPRSINGYLAHYMYAIASYVIA